MPGLKTPGEWHATTSYIQLAPKPGRRRITIRKHATSLGTPILTPAQLNGSYFLVQTTSAWDKLAAPMCCVFAVSRGVRCAEQHFHSHAECCRKLSANSFQQNFHAGKLIHTSNNPSDLHYFLMFIFCSIYGLANLGCGPYTNIYSTQFKYTMSTLKRTA